MRTVYLDPEAGSPPPPYRTGEAGHVWIAEDGDICTDVRVQLSANSTHALIGHGVLEDLNRLPLDGRLGEGRQVLLPPAVLDGAAAVIARADRRTYGGTWEFLAGVVEVPERVEYRVRVRNREYQVTLARLSYLMSTASREGRAAWIRI
jgi:hypothetical protein